MASGEPALDALAMTSVDLTGITPIDQEALAAAVVPARVMLLVRDRDARHWAPRHGRARAA